MKRIVKLARISVQHQEIEVEIPDDILTGETYFDIEDAFVKAAYDKARDTDFSGGAVTDSYQVVSMAMEDGTQLPPDVYVKNI